MKTTEEVLNAAQGSNSKNYKNLFIGALSFLVLAMGIYIVNDKSVSKKNIQEKQTQITTLSNEKSELQASFDASLVRLDSMSSVTDELNNGLNDKNKEIAEAKVEIRRILNQRNTTSNELAKAKILIQSLNSKIVEVEKEVARLTEANNILGEEKVVLTAEKTKLTEDLVTTIQAKQVLENKVDVGSTLQASNFNIIPFNIKKNGKERLSETAKRVKKMVVSFDLENRIIATGTTDVYVLVIGPDGKPVISQNNFSGKFNTREAGDKIFTAKLPVEIETAKTKNVSFAFLPETDFTIGDYKIEIYQNGFLIGQGTKTLKKGGLFS